MIRTKRQACDLFGGRVTDLARAVGVTHSAVSQWPEQLSQRQIDQVIGAAVRTGRYRIETPARNEVCQ